MREGPLTAIDSSYVDGPERFSGWTTNPLTTSKLKIVKVDDEGMGSLDQMNEHAWVFTLKMEHHAEFPRKSAAVTLVQLNTFLEVMHRRAMTEWQQQQQTNNVSELTESRIWRLAAEPQMEILKFMSPRYIAGLVYLLGVQFGNRYMDPQSGPGIALITSGSAIARNVCLNDTEEQDEVWFVMRRRDSAAPLSVVMQSYKHAGGPRLPDLDYVDLSGCSQRGVAWKAGFIAHKPHPDLRPMVREIANALRGLTEESHAAELNAPEFRVVLQVNGPKAMQI